MGGAGSSTMDRQVNMRRQCSATRGGACIRARGKKKQAQKAQPSFGRVGAKKNSFSNKGKVPRTYGVSSCAASQKACAPPLPLIHEH